MKIFIGFRKYDSVINMLSVINLPSGATTLHTYSVPFVQSWLSCCNPLVYHLCVLGLGL